MMIGRTNGTAAWMVLVLIAFLSQSCAHQNIEGTKIEDSVDLCTFLLEEMKVACVPGVGFGSDANIRLSYATSMESIEKGLDRIGEGLKRLA